MALAVQILFFTVLIGVALAGPKNLRARAQTDPERVDAETNARAAAEAEIKQSANVFEESIEDQASRIMKGIKQSFRKKYSRKWTQCNSENCESGEFGEDCCKYFKYCRFCRKTPQGQEPFCEGRKKTDIAICKLCEHCDTCGPKCEPKSPMASLL